MLKKIMGKWNAIIRGLRILNREYFSTRNDCLGKCGINSHYLPPTLLGKRENIFLYDNAYIDYRSVLYVTGGKLIIKENSIVAEGLTAITGQHQSKIGEVFGKAGNSNLLEKDIIVKNGKKTVTTVSFPFFCVVRLAAHVSNGLKSRIRPVVGRI